MLERFLRQKGCSHEVVHKGEHMVAELDILNEWIPEQMQPGTVFVLENAGEVGEKGRSLLGGAGVPVLRHAGADYAPANQRPYPRHLWLRAMFRAVLYSRSRSCRAQTVLEKHGGRAALQRRVSSHNQFGL